MHPDAVPVEGGDSGAAGDPVGAEGDEMTAASGNRPSVLWGIVPAGGAGTRLWPLSRAGAPKFLHDLSGSGRSLLQQTVARLEPLCGSHVVVVTGRAHEAAVRAQLPQLGDDGVLAEPSPRDSMAAIGLAAAMIIRRDPDAIVGSFAADHVVVDEPAFHDCVRQAVALARDGVLVTIGITPAFASTGFGYIHEGAGLGAADAPDGYAVQEFVEKPDAASAQRYVDSGEYRWNAGMFVAKATALLDLLAAYRPELAAGLRAIAAAPERLEEIWPDLERIAIDHAVAEPAAADGRVCVVRGEFGWDDVGDFAALEGMAPLPGGPDAEGIHVLGDPAQVLAQHASGLAVPGSGRLVAIVGIDNVVVVDTPDAVLVTSREHAQDVKNVVQALKDQGRADLT